MYNGLVYQYTSTRAGLLQCKKVYVGQFNTPPKLLSVTDSVENIIELQFSEPISLLNAGLMSNYTVISEHCDTVDIRNVIFDKYNRDKVILKIDSLKSGSFTVVVGSMVDDMGLGAYDKSISFKHKVQAKAFDLVFNEVMFDSYPIVDLPDADYIEIYNRSNRDINLSGWKLQVGDVIRSFADGVVKARGYLLVTSKANVMILPILERLLV
jgi:hypothetical protein